MRLRVQGPHPAVDQAERTADLAEHAYGWDSPEAVKYRRHVGERCAHAADWHRAVQNLTKSLEGHGMLYGAKDKRTNQVRELLHVALNHLDGGRGEHGKHGKSGGRTRGGRPTKGRDGQDQGREQGRKAEGKGIRDQVSWTLDYLTIPPPRGSRIN